MEYNVHISTINVYYLHFMSIDSDAKSISWNVFNIIPYLSKNRSLTAHSKLIAVFKFYLIKYFEC